MIQSHGCICPGSSVEKSWVWHSHSALLFLLLCLSGHSRGVLFIILSFCHVGPELLIHLILWSISQLLVCDGDCHVSRRQLAPVTSPALLRLQGLRKARGYGRYTRVAMRPRETWDHPGRDHQERGGGRGCVWLCLSEFTATWLMTPSWVQCEDYRLTSWPSRGLEPSLTTHHSPQVTGSGDESVSCPIIRSRLGTSITLCNFWKKNILFVISGKSGECPSHGARLGAHFITFLKMEISHLNSNSRAFCLLFTAGENYSEQNIFHKLRRQSVQTLMIRNIKTSFGYYGQNNGYYYTSIKI